MEEADREYWENLKLQDIFADQHPVHSYTERSFFTGRPFASVSQYKPVAPRLIPPTRLPNDEDRSDHFASLTKQLRDQIDLLLSSFPFKEHQNLMQKRQFVLQQKFLSQERARTRRGCQRANNLGATPNPSLDLCLDMIAPLLSAYQSIPFDVSLECIASLIKNGQEMKISEVINLLHTNSPRLQHPARFINQVRDWIETLIEFLRSKTSSHLRSQPNELLPVEKCILSFLDFGLLTGSVSCLLKASNHLLQYRDEFGLSEHLSEETGFTSALQRLFTVAFSEPQCFHSFGLFPVIIPDRKKCRGYLIRTVLFLTQL